jgi:molybdopterin/thiamine biosynthesis adenylyltransferase
MTNTGELRMLAEQFDDFRSAMLADAPLETVAMCGAGWWIDRDGHLNLLMRSWRVASNGDYIRRSPGGAVVTPAFIAPSVKRARATREAVLISHSHPFSSWPAFSGIDDGGEDELIPKIRHRAPDAPHGGFVVGTKGGSVRAWPYGASAPISLRQRVVGAPAVGGVVSPEFARQELALGPGTSAALAGMAVAVVGAGGLGWPIASALASHGIGTVMPIDPDVLVEHNRPRMPGSRPNQIGLAKVDALAAFLAETRPSTKVVSIPKALSDSSAREAIAGADAVVVATDNLASRLDADQLARRLLVPLVDVGVNIELHAGRLRSVGGRVNVSWPLAACLTCMGVLSPDRVAGEVDPLGYRGQDRAEEAAVMGFNMTLAGLAVNEVLALLLPIRAEPRSSRYLAYDGLRGIVRDITVPAAAACGTCCDLAGAVFGSLP